MQAATSESVDAVFVHPACSGRWPTQAAEEHGIMSEVVKLTEAKRGLVPFFRR